MVLLIEGYGTIFFSATLEKLQMARMEQPMVTTNRKALPNRRMMV